MNSPFRVPRTPQRAKCECWSEAVVGSSGRSYQRGPWEWFSGGRGQCRPSLRGGARPCADLSLSAGDKGSSLCAVGSLMDLWSSQPSVPSAMILHWTTMRWALIYMTSPGSVSQDRLFSFGQSLVILGWWSWLLQWAALQEHDHPCTLSLPTLLLILLRLFLYPCPLGFFR